MMRQAIWRELFVLAASAVPSIGAEIERPNVVIILTDDQGTLDARSFGSNDLETPAIDRLAARGHAQYFPDLIADRAVPFIARNQDRPFFLYYALNLG